MEPLDDKELDQLLHRWEAPAAPASLAQRVLPRRESWWRWLLTGTIRVPVPVGFAAVLLVVFWLYQSGVRGPAPAEAPRREPTVSLADFQPVSQLEPRLAGEQK